MTDTRTDNRYNKHVHAVFSLNEWANMKQALRDFIDDPGTDPAEAAAIESVWNIFGGRPDRDIARQSNDQVIAYAGSTPADQTQWQALSLVKTVLQNAGFTVWRWSEGGSPPLGTDAVWATAGDVTTLPPSDPTLEELVASLSPPVYIVED